MYYHVRIPEQHPPIHPPENVVNLLIVKSVCPKVISMLRSCRLQVRKDILVAEFVNRITGIVNEA
jgi:hypothetical protein